MAIVLEVNGQTFSFPTENDTNWGNNVTDWANAVSDGTLQRIGGSFSINSEVDFGNDHGLKSLYYSFNTTADVPNNATLFVKDDGNLYFKDGTGSSYPLTTQSGIATQILNLQEQLVAPPVEPGFARLFVDAADHNLYVTLGDGRSYSLTPDGSVTSVALAMPNIFQVTGSPVTTNGTLTASLADQQAHTVFAGPETGGTESDPTFRLLVEDDIPELGVSKIIGLAPSATTDTTDASNITTGSLGLARIAQGGAASNQVLKWNGTSWAADDTGTVTSVGLTSPTDLFFGSTPVTTNGSLTLDLKDQQANTFWAGPESIGTEDAPTFRTLVEDDIPALDPSKVIGLAASATTDTTNAGNISTGTLALARGGTGADMSATGPGYVKQATSGATFSTSATVPLTDLAAGSAVAQNVLVYSGVAGWTPANSLALTGNVSATGSGVFTGALSTRGSDVFTDISQIGRNDWAAQTGGYYYKVFHFEENFAQSFGAVTLSGSNAAGMIGVIRPNNDYSVNAASAETQSHPGNLFAVTNNVGYAGAATALATATFTPNSGQTQVYTFLFKTPHVVSDASNDYTFNVGVMSVQANFVARGWYIKYRHSVNGGNWQKASVNLNAGVETTSDTSIPMTPDTWQTLIVTLPATGTAVQYELVVNGVRHNLGTHVNTGMQAPTPQAISSAAGIYMQRATSTGVTAWRGGYIDRMSILITGMTNLGS